MTPLYRLGEIVLLPLVWAAIVLAALQSSLLIGATEHSVCGPWGCGPETGALVAMHAGWLAVIAPPLIYFAFRLKLQRRSVRRVAMGLFLLGLTGVFAIVAWQWLVWLPEAGKWSQDYIWQRCGFAIVTTVGNRSRAGLQKLKIAMDLEMVFRSQYLHEQDTTGTGSRNDARCKSVRAFVVGAY